MLEEHQFYCFFELEDQYHGRRVHSRQVVSVFQYVTELPMIMIEERAVNELRSGFTGRFLHYN